MAEARKIIVNNRPIIKDPAADQPDVQVTPPEGPKPPIATAKTNLKPTIEPPKPAEQPASKLETEAPKTAEPAPADEPAEEKPPIDPEAADQAEAAKQEEHDATIQKLIDDKKYVLSINSVEKRRTKRFLVLGLALSLVLAIAWVDVALDAGLIHLGSVKPLTHFFSN